MNKLADFVQFMENRWANGRTSYGVSGMEIDEERLLEKAFLQSRK